MRMKEKRMEEDEWGWKRRGIEDIGMDDDLWGLMRMREMKIDAGLYVDRWKGMMKRSQ